MQLLQSRVLEILKKEVAFLARMRHPTLLSVVETADESRGVLAFATEPIEFSLANALGNFRNFVESQEIDRFELDSVEVCSGLFDDHAYGRLSAVSFRFNEGYCRSHRDYPSYTMNPKSSMVT